MENQLTLPGDVQPVEWLTRESLFIDDKGNIWAKYVVEIKGEPQIRWHHLPEIETAIWQHFHILESYFGQYIGLDPRRARHDGEFTQVRRLANDVIKIARDYLLLTPPEQAATRDPALWLQNAIKVLGRVTNRYKQTFSTRVQTIKLPAEGMQAQTAAAAELLPAGGDLAKRAEEILGKSAGIKVRLAKLHRKHRSCINILANLYRELSITYARDQRTPMEDWGAKDIATLTRRFDPKKASAIAGLTAVNVQPYLKRARSPELRRLARLPRYLKDKNFDAVRKAIIGALQKMERVIAEIDQRFSPKVSALPPVKPVSPSP